MPDRRLEQAFRKVWEQVVPPDAAAQRQLVAAVINPDNTVNPDALLSVLPWQRLDFRILGPVATGTSQGGIYAVPQGGRIRHIAAHARVAPSSAPLTGRITGAAESTVISIPTGSSSNATGADITIPAGGVLRLDITSAGSAEDVTVTLHYSGGS